MRRFSDEVKHFDRKMKIAAIPCPATRNRTPAIFRPSFRRSHVRRGNLMPSGGRNRRRPYGSEIKDSRFTVPAVGFSTLPVLRHEVPSAEGNFAVGSGRMRGLWLQAAAAGEYECTGSERSRYLENMGSLIVLPSARPSGFSVFPGARNGPSAPDTCRILETVPAASVRIRW